MGAAPETRQGGGHGEGDQLIETALKTDAGTGGSPASYYLDIPVFHLEDHSLDQVHPTDIVIVKPNRLPDHTTPAALHDPPASVGNCTVITAKPLLRALLGSG